VIGGLRDSPPRLIDDRIMLLKELQKHLDIEEIDSYLKTKYWYQKLKEEGKFP